jgi:hypothetical protein
LEAMGLPPWRSGAAVRMSFGPLDDGAFIEAACARIAHCGAALCTDGMQPQVAAAAGWAAAAAPLDDELAAALELQPAAFVAFLLSHPDARLIDVREAREHRAGLAAALKTCRCRICRTKWPSGSMANTARWCFFAAAASAAPRRRNACTGSATGTPGTSPAASRLRPEDGPNR